MGLTNLILKQAYIQKKKIEETPDSSFKEHSLASINNYIEAIEKGRSLIDSMPVPSEARRISNG